MCDVFINSTLKIITNTSQGDTKQVEKNLILGRNSVVTHELFYKMSRDVLWTGPWFLSDSQLHVDPNINNEMR